MLSRGLLRALVVLCFGVGLSPTMASAEQRVALVIGNSAYRTVTALANPANDAKAIAALLTSAGFEITQAPDLTQSDMRRAIRDFAAKLATKGPDTVALVYYAGHGVQVDGENYLVPVDARIEREADLAIEAVRLADVMNALGSVPAKSRIVILDACRNNPFSDIVKTTGRGLAIVDAPKGSIVSYSTSPGAVAADGAGQHSPFTAALIDVARKPGLPIEQAFKQVRLSVGKATDGAQTPWESSSLTGDFAFFRAVEASAGAPTAAPFVTERAPQDPTQWRTRLISLSPDRAFELVMREDLVDGYEIFLSLYGDYRDAPRVRALFDRRQEMIAWFNAVNANSVLAFEAFLARYPNSDLSNSARRLMERVQNRSAFASAAPLAAAAVPQTREVVRIVEKPVERIVERPVVREVVRIVEKPVDRIVEKPVDRIVEKVVEKIVYQCTPGRPHGNPQGTRPPRDEGRPIQVDMRPRPNRPHGVNRPLPHRPVQNYPRNRFPGQFIR